MAVPGRQPGAPMGIPPGYRTLSCGGAGSMPLEFAVFSPDALSVVTVARDGLLQSWDAVQGKLAQTLVDEGAFHHGRGRDD